MFLSPLHPRAKASGHCGEFKVMTKFDQGYLVFVTLSQMLFFMNELSDVGMSASDIHNC